MLLFARAALARHEPEVRRDLVGTLEARDAVEGGDEPGRRHGPDHRHRLEQPRRGALAGEDREPVVRVGGEDAELTLARVEIESYRVHGGWPPGCALRR
jgi:hypothetical protein